MSRDINLIMKSKKIEIGSRVFFKNFPGYVEKDHDYLVLCEKELIPGKLIINMRKGKDDVFFMWNCGKEEILKQHAEFKFSPMASAKFIVPEVNRELNINLEDLKCLGEVMKKMDDKHTYISMIYYFYLENEKMELTSEQLEEAWKDYKEKRPDIYETRK